MALNLTSEGLDGSRNPVRQGDVFLYPQDAVPANAQPIDAPDFSVAYGETSGHAHALLEPTTDTLDHNGRYRAALKGVKFFRDPIDGTTYAEVTGDNIALAHVNLGLQNYKKPIPGELTTADHFGIPLAKGVYKVVSQVVVNPFTGVKMKAQD